MDVDTALGQLKDAVLAECREELIRELVEKIEQYRDGTGWSGEHDGEWAQHYIDGVNDAIGTLEKLITTP